MTGIGAVLLPLLLLSSPAHLLFGGPGTDWVLLSGSGEVRLRMREIGGVQPFDAATSPDGRRWAVSTRREQQNPELFLFSSLDAPPRRIVAKGNVLDGLRFSADGEWVYFSSNDEKQPTFDQQPMRYAQVYRVRFAKGEPERLTLSRGCHMWPRPLSATRVVVSHATCQGGRSLEILSTRSGEEKVLLPPTENVGETAPHPDGSKILFTRSVPAGMEFRLWDLQTNSSTLWTTLAVGGARMRPQWAEQGRVVLFQSGSRVLRMDSNGNAEDVLDLRVTP